MKRFIISLFALLLMVGVANATGIPQVADPKNYPVVWTEEVYSNSAAAITSGYIVQWDFSNSTGDYVDRCNWIKAADAIDDPLTAGVMITDSCAVNAVCQIAIRGPVGVLKTTAATITAEKRVGTGATGLLTDFAGGDDTSSLGVAINTLAPSTTTFVPVYVDPTCADL